MKKRSTKALALSLALATVLGNTSAFAAEYTVKAGDSLSSIAQAVLGDSSRWKELYDANKDTVKNPNTIYVGQTLTVPTEENTDTPAPVETPTETPVENETHYTDGTYTGTAMGFGGPITIEITIADNTITATKVTGADETPDVGGAALNRLGYLARTQGTEMDAVTGATYTSRGVKDALEVALAKAEGKTYGTPANGKYTKIVAGHEGSVNVSTMIVDGKIKSVTINSQDETEGVGSYAVDRIPSRIVSAQSLNVDAVGGATVTSTTIKQAVAEGLIAAGADLTNWVTAPAKEEIVPTEVTEDVDVVIAGAGTSGLMAAVRLIDAGVKNIILFEKQEIPGGSMSTAFGGFNGVGSQIYQNFAEGRLEGDATLKNMYYMSSWENIGDILGKAYGKTGEELPWLEQMYTKSGELYDWLVNQGVGFLSLGTEAALSSSPYFAPGCYSGGCGYFMEFLVNYIESRGVRIIYSTPVTELIQSEDGTVTGVKAVGEDGKTWTVNAKQTMLATGSFAKNKDLLETYHSEWADETFICPESLTGDGLIMALNAGGVVDYADAYMPGFLATYESHYELAFIHYMYCGMIVNINGDEFANITVSNHATMAAAKKDATNGNTFYYVFDDAAAATIRDYDARNMSYKAIFEKGEAVHYDTVEEASKALNLPNLAETIEKNNACYLAGEANEWGLSGAKLPYIDTTDGIWLVRVEPVVYLTTAGIRVDLDGHVLTENDTEIAGLWAAGDVIGSYEQRETRYGNGFDAAVSFGAVVGENIAETVKGETAATE